MLGYSVGGSGKLDVIIQTDDGGKNWYESITHSSPLTDVFFMVIEVAVVGNDRDSLLKIKSIWWTSWGNKIYKD